MRLLHSAARTILCRLSGGHLGILLLAAPTPSLAAAPPEVCFVPESDCGGLVAREIDAARSSIRAQAYTFTSPRIAHALARARSRGVDVNVVLDAKEAAQPNEASAIATLTRAGIPLRLDAAHATAHNKVLVLDGTIVITGSFNFTVSAERYSAENLLVLRDASLAQAYLANWARHWAHAQPR